MFSAILSLLLAACAGSGDQSSEYEEEDFDSTSFLPRTDLIRVSEFKTPSGKSWKVMETPMQDSSLVSVAVEAMGFSEDSITIELGEVDPILAMHQDDLDKDGFSELYLITQSTGPDAYGTIVGLSSNQDEGIAVISYEGATPYTMKEGEPYEGYMGHDRFVFKDGILTNTFPASKPGDTNAQPTSVERKVMYELVKGEMSMLLRPLRAKR